MPFARSGEQTLMHTTQTEIAQEKNAPQVLSCAAVGDNRARDAAI